MTVSIWVPREGSCPGVKPAVTACASLTGSWRRVWPCGECGSVGTSECSSGVVTARPARRVLSGEPTPGQAASVTHEVTGSNSHIVMDILVLDASCIAK